MNNINYLYFVINIYYVLNIFLKNLENNLLL